MRCDAAKRERRLASLIVIYINFYLAQALAAGHAASSYSQAVRPIKVAAELASARLCSLLNTVNGEYVGFHQVVWQDLLLASGCHAATYVLLVHVILGRTYKMCAEMKEKGGTYMKTCKDLNDDDDNNEPNISYDFAYSRTVHVLCTMFFLQQVATRHRLDRKP